MEDLLTPLQTIKVTQKQADVEPVGETEPPEASNSSGKTSIYSPEDALRTLRAQSNLNDTIAALKFLANAEKESFDVHAPTPLTARLADTIVGTVIPNFWTVLQPNQGRKGQTNRKHTTSGAENLLQCLKSITGLGAITARLRDSLVHQRSQGTGQGFAPMQHVSDLLDVLALLLNDAFVWIVWEDLSRISGTQAKLTSSWKELISLLCGGKLLSVAAEAVQAIKTSSSDVSEVLWIGDGPQYANWLGANLHEMLVLLHEQDLTSRKSWAQFLGRALSLGYTDQLLGELFRRLSKGDNSAWQRLSLSVRSMMVFEQRIVLSSLLKFLGQQTSDGQAIADNVTWWQSDGKRVGGAAAVISVIIEESQPLKGHLVAWLVGSQGLSTSGELFIPRAALAALRCDEDTVQNLLEKSMQQFGDNLFIKHKPIMHQEANAQILLLVAGYVHRSYPMYLFTLARSSTHLNAISNRLAASSLRSRFLGMVVGMAISELIDKPENKMKFGLEEVETPEARWYLSLTTVNDSVGNIDDLETETPETGLSHIASEKISRASYRKPSPRKEIAKKVKSAQVAEESDDEDLKPFAKPDSDPEDSDEDPTTIQRNKPTAPVYIRDLLRYLYASDSYDKFYLGLKTAPALIRRKSNFGTEVSDHVIELATLLTGLHDPFSIDDFHTLRLQAMIAILLSSPLQMAQWLARSVFEGDYSMGQRASMVTTLGLAARELAGFQDNDTLAAQTPFPTKMLPEAMHKLYSDRDRSPVASIASKLERSILEPLALQAADQLSGPTALKVRTFSSRLDVEKKRPKPAANDLAKVVAEGFFFPLTGRLWLALQSSSSVFTHQLLLPHIIRTLSLLLHASGPNTPLLPQLTTEFWDLCLSLRGPASSDLSVREALLFAFLTILEINTSNTHRDRSRQLAEEHARELVETLSWAQAVLADEPGGSGMAIGGIRIGVDMAGEGERSSGSGGKGTDVDTGVEEAERAKMLAAGVVVRCREIGEKWRGLMMGQGWED